jgi:hypothetical protein
MSKRVKEYIRTEEIDYKIEQAVANQATSIQLEDDRGGSGGWIFVHNAVCKAKYEVSICDPEGTKYMLDPEFEDQLLVTPIRVEAYPLPMKDFSPFEESVFEFLKGVRV